LKKSKSSLNVTQRHVIYEVDAPPHVVAAAIREHFQDDRTPFIIRALISQPDSQNEYRFHLEHVMTYESGPMPEAVLNGTIRRDGGRNITQISARADFHYGVMAPAMLLIVAVSVIAGIVLFPAPTLLDRLATGLMAGGFMGFVTGVVYVLIFITHTLNTQRLINRLEDSLNDLPSQVDERDHASRLTASDDTDDRSETLPRTDERTLRQLTAD
jgi:hypothetical protein